MTRSPIVVLGLVFQACSGGSPQRTNNPPAPEPEIIPEVKPEPVPEVPAPAKALPTSEAVPSSHPPGATNPPMPVLIVNLEGRCFKKWVSPMLPDDQHKDRVEDCKEACGGTEIACPPKAAELLAEKKTP